MKTFNMLRGTGKTTKMLFASEFNNAPILCATMQEKKMLIDHANNIHVQIPEPITISELSRGGHESNYFRTVCQGKILIDELDHVVSELFKQNYNLEIIGATITCEDKNGLK